MNLRKLTDTILKEGGISYSLRYGEINKGYAVSLDGFEEKTPIEEFDNVVLQNYVLDKSKELADADNFVGGWIQDGNVVLDVSTAFTSKTKALAFAKANKQQAIFDLENKLFGYENLLSSP